MAFIHYNPNPHGRFVGDCTVRAICKLTGQDWDTVYVGTFFEGFQLKNMPSGNEVWGAYLDRLGYVRRFAPDACPYCYRVTDFCRDQLFPTNLDLHQEGSKRIQCLKDFNKRNSKHKIP